MVSSATAYGIARPTAQRARQRSLPGIAIVAAVVTLAGLAYTAQTSSVANTGYDIAALQAQREQWQRRNDQLRLELARAQSLALVEREARTRLSMGPPARVVYAHGPVPGRIAAPAQSGLTGSQAIAELRSSAERIVQSVARAVGD
jgi:hypothetical protein